jgi:hypothetical protein
MQRGFKTKAEKMAVEARALVKVPAYAPLPARRLAVAMRVPIIGPTDIPDVPTHVSEAMLSHFAANWSAVTLCVGDGFLIIHNTSHLPPRQESDLMHELAHILCQHKPARIEAPGMLPWASRSYDSAQEEEAAWLGGCLQEEYDRGRSAIDSVDGVHLIFRQP